MAERRQTVGCRCRRRRRRPSFGRHANHRHRETASWTTSAIASELSVNVSGTTASAADLCLTHHRPLDAQSTSRAVLFLRLVEKVLRKSR